MRVRYLLLLIWFTLFISSRLPGELEAYFFPVLRDITIEVSAASPAPHVRQTMMLHFTEIRQGCDLNSMFWYKVAEDGTKIRLVTYVEDLIIDEKDNSKRTIVWTLPVKTSDFLIKSDKIIFDYTCHPFWNTYTTIKRF